MSLLHSEASVTAFLMTDSSPGWLRLLWLLQVLPGKVLSRIVLVYRTPAVYQDVL